MMYKKSDFLSPEWEVTAQEITDSTTVRTTGSISFTLNTTISPTPYGDKFLCIRVTENLVHIDRTLIDSPDINILCDYDTAYSLFLGGDMNVILSAMLEGKITVQGDIAKLLTATMSSGPLPSMNFLDDLASQLRAITNEI